MTTNPNQHTRAGKPDDQEKSDFDSLLKSFLAAGPDENPARTEPRPEFVQFARVAWEMYTACAAAGFKPHQAMQLTIAALLQQGEAK